MPPSALRIEALPRPAVTLPTDLSALAESLGRSGAVSPPAGLRPASLRVFISFAMPEATLARLVEQAERAGATLVLRGLVDGSLRETLSRLQPLIGKRQVALQIDPEAFDRYSIRQTPTFVLARGDTAQPDCTSATCTTADDFLLAAGDVSLDYVLRHFERAVAASTPALAHEASRLLRRMRGAP